MAGCLILAAAGFAGWQLQDSTLKQCETVADCVIVDCGCDCSGGRGYLGTDTVASGRESLFELKNKASTGVLDSTAELLKTRREVARCLTVARAKQMTVPRWKPPKKD